MFLRELLAVVFRVLVATGVAMNKVHPLDANSDQQNVGVVVLVRWKVIGAFAIIRCC